MIVTKMSFIKVFLIKLSSILLR